MKSLVWLGQIKFPLKKSKKKIGLTEKEVIFIMRKNLKKKSYIVWRKRVRGRISKHRKKTKADLKYYEF